MLSLAVWCSTF